jgi:PAS domain S-box-containing protein
MSGNGDVGPDQRELHWSTTRWGAQPPSLPMLDPVLMGVLLEHINTRVAVIGRDGRYLYANLEALRFMGLPPERVIGRHMSEVLDDGVYRSFVPIFERLFAGESLHLQGWVNYELQGRRYREQVLVPYTPGGGPVQAVVVCGLDHTDLRLGEEELALRQEQLRASEALKSAIVDHALAALISTDADGRIVEFNPSAETIFGRRRAEVVGRPVSEVIVPERHRAAHEAGLRRMQAGGPAQVLGQRMELHALRADGSEFPIEMVLWRSDVGGTAFYTASIADVSERHDAARQIERQREALRQGERLTAMGSLLAGVAHELNNPLAIVMGRATLLEEKLVEARGEDRPDLQHDVRRIREAAERCGRIVRTFLNMARSRPSQRGAVALNDLVRASADLLGYTYRSHNVALQLDLAPQLPSVMGDGDQISQIVLNLMVNAQQALTLTVGERRVHVSTGVEQRRTDREPRVWLRVVDTGPGVAPEVRARLFETFFTTKPEGLGTGLGLSVSRSVAREHGGELVLESTTQGASFRLSLPLSGEAEPPAEAPVAAPTEVPALAQVLVVDDEPELAELLRDMLERAGYAVATAVSGAVALELLEAARFDAVVSDLRMPDMDGSALWRAASARQPELAQRFLFVTGDTLSPDASEFLKATRCAGLDKPFSKPDLLAKMAEMLKP